MSNTWHRSAVLASILCFQWGCSSESNPEASNTTAPTSNGVTGTTGTGTSTGTTGATTTSTGGNPVTGSVTGGTTAGTTGAIGVTSGTTTTDGTNTTLGMGGASSTTTDGATTTGSTTGSVALPPLVTSAPGAYWDTAGTLTDSTAAATVTVNDTPAQTWDGFGAAFNERGWSYLTSDEMKSTAITLLFSDDAGANFAWGRIPIGASDYAIERYTLADTGTDVEPNGETNRPPADPTLDSFSLDQDKMYLIPYIHAAQAEKPDLRFWASPWTPPVWMKTGFKTNSGADSSMDAERPSFFDGGNMNSAYLEVYAEYFKRFVEGYAAEGIDIEVVSPQNEPGYDQNYPSCLWDGATYATFVADHLGPVMDALGVSVMLGSLSNQNTDFMIASTALANSTAKGYFSVIGAQWNTLDKGQLDGLNSGLPYWASEHKCGNYPWNPEGYPAYQQTAPNDQAYAVESWGYIRDAIKTIGVTSYNAWNMVLDPVGWGNDTTRDWAQDALLVADGGQVSPTPAYWVFRHFSQYVQPGAKVVGATGGDAVAFKNPDNSFVVVMFNSGGANPSYVLSAGGKSYQFAMPGNGWATVKVGP